MTGLGLDDSEARAVADRFGVAIEQVRRDHLISHILAALGASHGDQVIFFGGTALARTYLQAGRLSEDIDLIATGSRRETAAAIEQTLDRALRRSHGRISWAPQLTAVRDTDAAVLLANDGQLASADSTPRSPRLPALDHRAARDRPALLGRRSSKAAYADSGLVRCVEDGRLARPKRPARSLGSVGTGPTRRDHRTGGQAVRRARTDRQHSPAVDVQLGTDRAALADPTGQPDTLDRQRGGSLKGSRRRMSTCQHGDRS